MKILIGDALRVPAWTRQEGMSQEIQMLHEAERFRRLAALAWDEATIYPKNEYRAGCSDGQCGVTNFGFGLWLSRMEVASVDQMVFEEGEITTADGSSLGENHTWLRVDNVDDGCMHADLSMRFDLAADQFPPIHTPAVVQYDDYFYPDPQTSSGNRIYVSTRVTPLPDYDTNRFAGRLDRFMHNICGVAAASCVMINL